MPSVYVYTDRIEIISYGGLPFWQTEENFFKGISKPRSKSFIRILRDLDFAERTGHGIPQIINKYGRKAFDITDTFILVTLPYDPDVVSRLNKNEHPDEHPEFSNRTREEIIAELIESNPYITYDEIALKLGISVATVRRTFASLRKKGIIANRINQHDKWTLKN